MKSVAGSRLMWTVIGLVLVAVLGFAALGSRMTVAGGSLSGTPAASVSSSAKPSAMPASAQPSAQAQASGTQNPDAGTQSSSKPFLSDYQDPQPQSAPNGFLTIVKLIVSLGVVLGLIYLTILGLRYFSNRGRGAFLGTSAINVLEKTPLAQNRELYLIDVADKVLLLGATTTTISVLTEITDERAIEDLRTRPQPSLPSAEPFLNYLKKVGEHARPIAAEVAAAATSHPSELLKPADLLKRIEDHKLRVKERTLALQENEA